MGRITGRVSERVARLRIEAVSPDGSVRAALTTTDIGLRLRPGMAERHTDAGLARQVGAALAAVFQGYGKAVAMLRAELADGRPTTAPEDLAAGHPRRRLREAASELVVEAFSRDDFVAVTWRGAADFTVELRPGTIRRLTEDELREELESALAAAARQRRRQMRDVHAIVLREVTG